MHNGSQYVLGIRESAKSCLSYLQVRCCTTNVTSMASMNANAGTAQLSDIYQLAIQCASCSAAGSSSANSHNNYRWLAKRKSCQTFGCCGATGNSLEKLKNNCMAGTDLLIDTSQEPCTVAMFDNLITKTNIRVRRLRAFVSWLARWHVTSVHQLLQHLYHVEIVNTMPKALKSTGRTHGGVNTASNAIN